MEEDSPYYCYPCKTPDGTLNTCCHRKKKMNNLAKAIDLLKAELAKQQTRHKGKQ